MRFMRVVRWVLWKDMVCEMRSRETFSAMSFFALTVTLIFSFSLPENTWGGQEKHAAAFLAGMIWVALGFTAVIGLGRVFLQEAQNDCMEALQLIPVHKGAIYLGKFAGHFLFVFAVEWVLYPAFGLLFNFNLLPKIPQLLLISVGATIGLCALGTLFSAMTIQVRARDVMFPILLLPLAIPLFIGAVEATRGALAGAPFSSYRHWVELLFIFDMIMGIVSFWLFEWIMEGG